MKKHMSQADDKNRYFLKSQGFNENGKSYIVMGDTYSIKDELKSIGGKFNYALGWRIPNNSEKYETVEIDISDVTNKDENGRYVYKPMRELQEIIKKKKKEYKEDAHIATTPDDNISKYIVGKIGDKIKVDATLKSAYTYETHFSYYGGTSTIYTFVMDNGNVIVWNTPTVAYYNDRPIEDGNKYTITGTIKDFKEYYGEKETVLTRVNVTSASMKESIDFDPNGYYRKDGVFVPAHDPKTGLPLIPKEIWDEWE